MIKSALGRLEIVDLREVWDSESGSFTPWLAQDDNLQLLGDTIGLELELEAQETKVGPFRADILCKDTATDHWVLIENQLERTDHGHLGQLLTYAAGLEAVTIVWIAERFTEEHRATLDWLNEITDERFNFFGLEIELWRIGNSPLAPKFNIVSKPNDWTRTIYEAATSRGDLTETKQLQLEYWTEFANYLVTRKSIIKPQKPLPQHWMNFAIGKSHIHLAAFVNTKHKRITVGLILTGPEARSRFHALEKQRTEIEGELGTPLDWQELIGKKEKNILLRHPDTDPVNKEDWPRQHKWLADHLEAFHHTFAQRIRELDASEPELENDSGE